MDRGFVTEMKDAAGTEGGRRATGVSADGGAGEGPRDPEVVEKAKRRRFTPEYRLKIVHAAEACRGSGEIGALLRREGLFSSQLSTWRRQREEGAPRSDSSPSPSPLVRNDPLVLAKSDPRKHHAGTATAAGAGGRPRRPPEGRRCRSGPKARLHGAVVPSVAPEPVTRARWVGHFSRAYPGLFSIAPKVIRGAFVPRQRSLGRLLAACQPPQPSAVPQGCSASGRRGQGSQGTSALPQADGPIGDRHEPFSLPPPLYDPTLRYAARHRRLPASTFGPGAALGVTPPLTRSCDRLACPLGSWLTILRVARDVLEVPLQLR